MFCGTPCTIVFGTVVPTMIVGKDVQTIIALMAYYWKSCIPFRINLKNTTNHSCRSGSCQESDYFFPGHFLNPEEVRDIKTSWNRVIGDDTGNHGIKILLRWVVLEQSSCRMSHTGRKNIHFLIYGVSLKQLVYLNLLKMVGMVTESVDINYPKLS